MSNHPTAADVLREHYQNATTWEREQRTTGWRCTCGQRGPGDHRDHIADMLRAARLLGTPAAWVDCQHEPDELATPEHDAAVRAQALRDAADQLARGRQDAWYADWLRARADRQTRPKEDA